MALDIGIIICNIPPLNEYEFIRNFLKKVLRISYPLNRSILFSTSLFLDNYRLSQLFFIIIYAILI